MLHAPLNGGKNSPLHCPHEYGNTSAALSQACRLAEDRLSRAVGSAADAAFVVKEGNGGMLAIDEHEFLGMILTIAELESENLRLRHEIAGGTQG